MDFPINNGDFHSYVNVPEGIHCLHGPFSIPKLPEVRWREGESSDVGLSKLMRRH